MSVKRQRTPTRCSPSSPSSPSLSSSTLDPSQSLCYYHPASPCQDSSCLSMNEKKEENKDEEERYTLVCFPSHGEAYENDTYVVLGITKKQLDVFDKLLRVFQAEEIQQSCLMDLFTIRCLELVKMTEEELHNEPLNYTAFCIMENALESSEIFDEFIQSIPKEYKILSPSKFNKKRFNNVAARVLMGF